MPRETNVFGLPVELRPTTADVAAAGVQMVVASRCADLPSILIPEPLRSRNRTTRCDGCGELCWYDPKYAIPGLRVRCQHCAPTAAQWMASDDQVAEVLRLAARG